MESIVVERTERDVLTVLSTPRYSFADVAAYLRVPTSTVRAWCASGERREAIVLPADTGGLARLSFLNLVEVHVLDALRREYRLALSRIRLAVAYLREHERLSHPLARTGLLTDRRDVFIEALRSASERDLVNASRFGQVAMADLVAAHLERVVWNAEGWATRLYPFSRLGHDSSPRVVAIDPAIAFGRPMIASRAVPVGPIAARFNAGESILELADDYRVPANEIEEAIRWVSGRPRATAA